MKKLLFISLILLMCISAVSASQNSDDFKVNDAGNISQGPVGVGLEDNASGIGSQDEQLNVSDDGLQIDDSLNDTDDVNDTNSSDDNSSKIKIKAQDMVAYYKDKPVYRFRVVNATSQPVSGLKLKVIFKGKGYDRTTDGKGFASFTLPGNVGKYAIQIRYQNVTVKKTITIYKLKTFSKNVHSHYGKKVRYKLRVLNNYGKAMAGLKVTFKVGKKKYRRNTNSKGYAILKLNYDAGRYKIRYSVNGVSGKNWYVVKNRISLKVMKWGIRGDVSKVYLIKKYMPNSYWVKKVVAATKKGIPLLTIKGGKGKTVFMTAGVHGNELPPQVAIMKTIKGLSEKPVKGTVYIIPFVNVKAINKQVRLTNYDFNRVAHKPGTVSNKIVKLIFRYKCDSYGDFHSTVKFGVPGKNIILGYKSPAKKCIPLTIYLSKNCNVGKKFYRYAGEVYRWSLADKVNYKGTPAVICEVVSGVNKAPPKACSLSYRMMNKFLRYNRII